MRNPALKSFLSGGIDHRSVVRICGFPAVAENTDFDPQVAEPRVGTPGRPGRPRVYWKKSARPGPMRCRPASPLQRPWRPASGFACSKRSRAFTSFFRKRLFELGIYTFSDTFCDPSPVLPLVPMP